MLKPQKRKEIIEYIINEAMNRRDVGGKSKYILEYQLNFQLCSLHITQPTDDNSVPVVKITENFGRIDIKPKYPDLHDGFRLVYGGSVNGLDKVALEGIRVQGDGGLVASPTKRLSLYKDDVKILSKQDKETFDVFLMYAQRELKRSK